MYLKFTLTDEQLAVIGNMSQEQFLFSPDLGFVGELCPIVVQGHTLSYDGDRDDFVSCISDYIIPIFGPFYQNILPDEYTPAPNEKHLAWYECEDDYIHERANWDEFAQHYRGCKIAIPRRFAAEHVIQQMLMDGADRKALQEGCEDDAMILRIDEIYAMTDLDQEEENDAN